MFSLWALKLVVAFIAASALAQDDCKPYSYPPLDQHRNELPARWAPAKILPNDGEAWGVWQSISHSIPNIPPKQTNAGSCPQDYDYRTDPDCCELLFHLEMSDRGGDSEAHATPKAAALHCR